ncbi:FecR family protein [Hymenobacter jejuensis]|uniref:DUF4974 domain-containing protein n=1 Tax=Hymenobacter jejuensis TaxID=2502781 RepID=A0A5B8A3D5_9BACT|nr:FecR domain-containing protein [Hymenobacter jejuensis]QDA61639.1 DUF4974 domain-containing protein [Hymenobacter jejuensis]
MPTEVNFEAYLRYVRSESTPGEARAVRAWLAQPTNAFVAQQWMQAYADMPEHDTALADDSHDYGQMLAQLRMQAGLATPASTDQRWYRWAAAAVIAGVLAGGGWLVQRKFTDPGVAYATAYGQTKIIHLPDGSEVTLNAHSTLRHASAWEASKPREVWLDGEAFFAVKHLSDNKRFVVHTTAGLNVEVLGTTFDVYRRHQQARVVLLSGKVLVDFDDPQRSDVTMHPGELVQVLDKQTDVIKKAVSDPSDYTTWTTNRMVFAETPLEEVATRLQDTYGVEVTLRQAELKKRKFTGAIPVGDVDLLCQTLEETLQVKIKREANRIVISAP